jgi:hypothetical protein
VLTTGRANLKEGVMERNANEGAGDIERLALAMSKAIEKLDEAIYSPDNVKPEQIEVCKFVLENAEAIAKGFKYVDNLRQ